MVTEPSNQVGKEMLFENDAVRVWMMELAPGEPSPLHRHEADYFFLMLTANRIAAMPAGSDATTSDFFAGHVQYVRVDEPIVHQIENVSDERHLQVVVELKSLAVRPPSSSNGRRRSI